MDEFCLHNQTLKDDVNNIRQCEHKSNPLGDMETLDPHQVSDSIWGELVPEGFKSPSLAKFNGPSDPYEHVAFINTQLVIVGASDSLKCNIFSCTFRDTTLQWYMGLSRISISNYQKLVKKILHQFATSRHKKISTTSVFYIQQGPSKSIRDYLT